MVSKPEGPGIDIERDCQPLLPRVCYLIVRLARILLSSRHSFIHTSPSGMANKAAGRISSLNDVQMRQNMAIAVSIGATILGSMKSSSSFESHS
jgi:hypothetical protein